MLRPWLPGRIELVVLTLGEQAVADLKSEGGQRILGQAHEKHERPRCGCRTPGVPMYVASTPSGFVVKRMPGSGASHAPDCASWEPPEALSGLGQVTGEAITTNPDDGTTTLRLGFSLSKSAGRAAPEPSEGEPADSVAADGTKLTLRALLHYLWDEAGLSVWSPAMTGKRNWRVVSWYLRQAAAGKTAKRQALGGKLFVPEAFDVDHKAQVAARRLRLWSTAQAKPGKSVPLLVLVGEVKSFEDARYGKRLVVKHLPDAPYLVDDDLHRRLYKRFAVELQMWEAHEKWHLMTIATFAVNTAGIASVQEMALMVVDEHWLPVESPHTELLLAAALDADRRFRVGLRYNLPATAVSAAVIFTDTPDPVAAFILGPDDDPASTAELVDAHAGTALWQWRVDDGFPNLPPAQTRPREGDRP